MTEGRCDNRFLILTLITIWVMWCRPSSGTGRSGKRPRQPELLPPSFAPAEPHSRNQRRGWRGNARLVSGSSRPGPGPSTPSAEDRMMRPALLPPTCPFAGRLSGKEPGRRWRGAISRADSAAPGGPEPLSGRSRIRLCRGPGAGGASRSSRTISAHAPCARIMAPRRPRDHRAYTRRHRPGSPPDEGACPVVIPAPFHPFVIPVQTGNQFCIWPGFPLVRRAVYPEPAEGRE